jgi:hypothetical protein
MRFFFALVSICFSSSILCALPSSARLFQQTYSYRTSCYLCHASGGGSELDKFGKDFVKAGGNKAAFKKIETKDSDGDGIENLKEIIARSNAGDKKSTPQNPGKWLDDSNTVPIPLSELKELYPGFADFTALEGALSEAQISSVSSQGVTVLDDDRVPTFYFPMKDGKKSGVAQILNLQSGTKKEVCFVAVTTAARIENIMFPEASAAEWKKELIGKSVSELPAKLSGNDAELALICAKKALAVMKVVFGS